MCVENSSRSTPISSKRRGAGALTSLLSFRNVIEEPFTHIERSPLGPKARSALHLAQGRQQGAVEFPGTFASHRSLDMEPVMSLSHGACRARKFVVTINWLCRMSRGRKGGPMVVGPDSQAALGKPLDVSRIHAATGNDGAREYSRRSPPSLSSHVTGPDTRTGSERAI